MASREPSTPMQATLTKSVHQFTAAFIGFRIATAAGMNLRHGHVAKYLMICRRCGISVNALPAHEQRCTNER